MLPGRLECPQNLPWVGWRDETISQIEGASVGGGERKRESAL